jgi:hypothetical protein
MVSARDNVACAAAATRAVLNRVRWLAALGALVCAVMVPAVPARAEGPGGLNCFSERESTKTIEEYAKLLSPAEGATVAAGTPVTFFTRGGGESPMTFMVASSPALLSSPDIDGGLGTMLPRGYETELVPPEYKAEEWLTSTKTTATPRTVYWTASFTLDLRFCDEPPVTFTLPPRTLTVVPSPVEERAAAKQKQEAEAAAAKRKKEAEAAARPTGSVSLVGSAIIVQSSGGEAAVKLACRGTGTCSGKLTLTGKSKTKNARTRTETIGTAGFSIPAGKTATVEFKLNAAGRALLGSDHGPLSATMTILKSSPAPAQAQTEGVRLVQEKAHGKAKKATKHKAKTRKKGKKK